MHTIMACRHRTTTEEDPEGTTSRRTTLLGYPSVDTRVPTTNRESRECTPSVQFVAFNFAAVGDAISVSLSVGLFCKAFLKLLLVLIKIVYLNPFI